MQQATRATLGSTYVLLLVVVLATSCRNDRDLLRGPPSRNPDGTINVVVEIPAGTNAKWEVRKKDGILEWQKKKGRPRIVSYLPYPGNYGMIPRTLLPTSQGGDGDPVDVLVLGPAVERGSIIPVRLVGVLVLRDKGEQDDKLLAVSSNGPLSGVTDVSQLEREFPGVIQICRTWFENYKGPGKIEILHVAGPHVAEEILQTAENAFRE